MLVHQSADLFKSASLLFPLFFFFFLSQTNFVGFFLFHQEICTTWAAKATSDVDGDEDDDTLVTLQLLVPLVASHLRGSTFSVGWIISYFAGQAPRQPGRQSYIVHNPHNPHTIVVSIIIIIVSRQNNLANKLACKKCKNVCKMPQRGA